MNHAAKATTLMRLPYSATTLIGSDRKTTDAINGNWAVRNSGENFVIIDPYVRVSFFSPVRSIRLADLYDDVYLPSISSVYRRNKLAAIASNNNILIPFKRISDSRIHFLQSRIYPESSTQIIDVAELDPLTIEVLEEDEFVYWDIGLLMYPVINGFLVYIVTDNSKRVYHIDFNGAIENVYQGSLSQIFEYQGQLYAVSISGDVVIIIKVSQDGKNWEAKYSLNSISFRNPRFHPTENNLILNLSNVSQLLVATELNESNISFEALDFEELSSYDVTDVESFEGEIYISTLSGVFKRNYIEFIESRAE